MDRIRRSPYRPAASESAAKKGLTEDRTRSHLKKVRNYLRNGRQPQKSSAKSYAKGERNENLCDPLQPSWKAERPEPVRHLMFRIPGVDAGKVDVFPTERRDVLQQSVRNVSPYSFQLCFCAQHRQGCRHSTAKRLLPRGCRDRISVSTRYSVKDYLAATAEADVFVDKCFCFIVHMIPSLGRSNYLHGLMFRRPAPG